MTSKKAPRLDLDFSPEVATLAAVQFQSAEAARMALASELNSANNRLAGTNGERSRAEPSLDPRVSKATNQVARELQVPWADLLAALEAVPTYEVALLGVEPSAHRHVVRITGEAKNSGAMLDYLDALQAPKFSDVCLASHQIQTQTPGTPVRLIVQMKWGGR